MILVVAGGFVVLSLTAGCLYDRRHRREGHGRRSGADMMYDVREVRRDARAWDSLHGLADSDLRWTAASRRNNRRR